MKRKISYIFLRVILYIYSNQYYSERFSVSNGIRQGGISSPIFWNIYLDRLIKKIRRLGMGCHVAGKFIGIFIYADDIFLLSPSIPGLQAMVDVCQRFAQKNNLTFSTNPNPTKSKTKCIVFSKKPEQDLVPILLNKSKLPWVPSLKHLGMTLQSDNSMSIDIGEKWRKFIGKIQSLRQEFYFVDPNIMMKILEIYTMSFYGSPLYDIFSKECERIFSTYNSII